MCKILEKIVNHNTAYRILAIILPLLFGTLCIDAQVGKTISKPTITKEMCVKLWYGCQCYDMAKALFYHSMGAKGIIDNDRLMESMKNGNIEVGENFVRAIQTLYGREDAWANFKIFGFKQNELEITNDLYTFFEAEEWNKEKLRQEHDYEKWLKFGVPTNVRPTIKPLLYCSDMEALASFFNDHPELVMGGPYEIRVFVDSETNMRLFIDDKKLDTLIFSNLYLQAEEPAFVTFDKINKELPASCLLDITLTFHLENVSDDWHSEYEASTKYDKKKDTWSITITKEYAEKFNKEIGKEQESYLRAIDNALRREKEKPKKYVKFNLYNVKIQLTYKDIELNSDVIIFKDYIFPLAQIIKSQSAFSKFKNG